MSGDTNGRVDVFVRDRLMGTTERVSTSSTGVEGNGDSGDDASGAQDISADGQRVVFHSWATNLVASDLNQDRDVFMRERTTGVTIRVSVTAGGMEASGGWPAISGDGRYLAFQSFSSAFIGPLNSAGSIFRKDLLSGAVDHVSVSQILVVPGGTSSSPSISHDGRIIGFGSWAFDLVLGDSNGAPDMFVRDMQSPVCELVSRGLLGNQSQSISQGRVSSNGRFVTFSTLAKNFVPGVSGGTPILVRDRQLNTLRRVDLASTGVEGYGGYNLDTLPVSDDGQSVAFSSGSLRIQEPFGSTYSYNQVYLRVDTVPPPHTVFCSGQNATCPCNVDLPWAGCTNSATTGGGQLLAIGNAAVTVDTVQLVASGLPTNASAIFFQGTSPVNGGAGVILGDGLLCVTGNVIRLGLRTATVGSVSMGFGVGSDPLVSAAGLISPAGGLVHYQCWYRDSGPHCSPATHNQTNAISILWMP
ncbi:MAG: PD40 domain-containing protein [Planctomycetes bacterium]|nr:PD40 domain-containing protein [Planctomycetota bacterium]